MTLAEARRRALRLTVVTGQPAVLFRSRAAGWEVWHTLDAAKWLGEDGEVILPAWTDDLDGVERRLRAEAARLQGAPRLKLLRAAWALRNWRAVQRALHGAMA
jgi:hypothetical protein